MAERAAHLLDHVFPDVPVRQCRAPVARLGRDGVEWVLSLPYRLRQSDDFAFGRTAAAIFLATSTRFGTNRRTSATPVRRLRDPACARGEDEV